MLSSHKGGTSSARFTMKGPVTESKNHVPRSQALRAAVPGLALSLEAVFCSGLNYVEFIFFCGKTVIYQLFHKIKECTWHWNF